MKTCSTCNSPKSEKDFYVRNKKTGSLRNDCKNCVKQRNNKHYHNNAEDLSVVRKGKYLQNREAVRKEQRQYYLDNQERIKHKVRQHREDNLEACLAREKLYRHNNREQACQRAIAWREKNPDKCKALDSIKAARRRAGKLQRTPAWSETEGIIVFYKSLGDKVGDHIIALQGKTVSGLHVVDNLQPLTALDNLRKGNYHESQDQWDPRELEDLFGREAKRKFREEYLHE